MSDTTECKDCQGRKYSLPVPSCQGCGMVSYFSGGTFPTGCMAWCSLLFSKTAYPPYAVCFLCSSYAGAGRHLVGLWGIKPLVPSFTTLVVNLRHVPHVGCSGSSQVLLRFTRIQSTPLLAGAHVEVFATVASMAMASGRGKAAVGGFMLSTSWRTADGFSARSGAAKGAFCLIPNFGLDYALPAMFRPAGSPT